MTFGGGAGIWAQIGAATQVVLTADELAHLDQVSRLPAEYPGWMFERQGEYRRKQIADAGRSKGNVA